MFEEAARIGGLDVQLAYYRGADECSHSSWFADAARVGRADGRASGVRPAITKIGRVLEHVRAEHAREKVGAAVLIGDAVEELPQTAL